jgi:hypothetical protein
MVCVCFGCGAVSQTFRHFELKRIGHAFDADDFFFSYLVQTVVRDEQFSGFGA